VRVTEDDSARAPQSAAAAAAAAGDGGECDQLELSEGPPSRVTLAPSSPTSSGIHLSPARLPALRGPRARLDAGAGAGAAVARSHTRGLLHAISRGSNYAPGVDAAMSALVPQC